MNFNDGKYTNAQVVAFGGTTFALAQVSSGAQGGQIAYTYLDTNSGNQGNLDAEDNAKADDEASTDESWTHPGQIEFPTQVRPIGMALITEPVFDPDTGAPATSSVLGSPCGFTLVVDGANLWIFRTGADQKSILADRFFFDSDSGRLVKASDVRFIYSGHADLPADQKDRYGSSDPIGDDFTEPTFKLGLDAKILEQPCAVVLVPDALKSKSARWHIFATQDGTNRLLRYSIPYSSRAWFDLTDEEYPVNAYLELRYADSISDQNLTMSYPSVSLYEQQELAFTAVGEPQLVQRALRALLVCQATVIDDASVPPRLACYDMALGIDGSMPQIYDKAALVPIQDYQTALALDGRGDSVTLAEGCAVQVDSGGLFLSVWLKWSGPNAVKTQQTILSLNSPNFSGPSNFTLCIDETGRLTCPGFDFTVVGKSATQLQLMPEQWANVAVSLVVTNEGQSNAQAQLGLYVNGFMQGYGWASNALSGAFNLTLGQSFGQINDPSSATNFLGGLLGQVFAVQTWYGSEELPANAVYTSNPDVISPPPVIFWAFGEGHGTSLGNAPGLPVTYMGDIQGATWVPSICPDQSTMPARYVDEHYLDVRSALIDPADTTSDAPPLKPETRVSMMRGADGFVHVYFLQSDDRGGVLHMTSETQRARYTISQDVRVQADGEPEYAEYIDVMALVARQAGTVWGQTDITFGSIEGDYFATVEFSSRVFPNIGETWSNVPTRLDLFAQVINGQAAQTPSGEAPASDVEAAWDQTQYDYVHDLRAKNPESGSLRTIDGPTPSALFEVVVPHKLLAQTPVLTLTPVSVSALTAAIGNDPGWVMAPLSPSLRLAGTSGPNLQTEPADHLGIDGDLTLQCWIKLDEYDSGSILTYDGDQSSYQMKLSSSGDVTVQRTGFDAVDMGGVSRTSLTPLPLSKWTHVAAVYESSFALHFLPGVYVKCDGSSDFDLPEAFTVEAWVKFDEISKGRGVIASRQSDEAGQSAFELSVDTTSDTDRSLRFDTFLADGRRVPCEGDFSCAANSWVHVAGKFHSDITMNYLAFQDDDENCIKIGQPTQDPLSTFTVEMNLNVRDSAKQCFVSYDRKDDGGKYETRNYFQVGYLYPTSGSGQRLSVEVEDCQVDISTNSWDPTDPAWQDLAVVLETTSDGATTYLTVYVNGELAELDGGTSLVQRIAMPRPFDAGSINDYKKWCIGAEWDRDGRGDFPDMDLREFRLWTVARSQSDILDGLQTPYIGSEPSLARYIVCDESKNSGARYVIDQVSGDSFKIHTRNADDEIDIIWNALEKPGKSRIYVNGVTLENASIPGPNNTLAQVSTPMTIGRRTAPNPGSDPRTLMGAVDDVRIWSSYRRRAQIDFFSKNRIPNVEQQPNLVSYWRFNKPRGTSVPDIAGGHTGTVKGLEFAQASDAQALWEPSIFGADWTIYLDGKVAEMAPREVKPSPTTPPDVDNRLHIGSGSTPFSNCIFAALSELQIWSETRTQKQIGVTRFQPLVPVDGLAAYYRFNDGSGARATDQSGFAQDADIAFSSSSKDPDTAWTAYGSSTSPLSVPVPIRDESMAIVDATNGYAYDLARNTSVSCAPSAVEDFNTSQRIYGWCESAIGDVAPLSLTSDVPLADTDLVYLGQIQYKPQLVGYIEGAPPVPSENLTIDAPSNPDRYLNNSTTSISIAKDATIDVSAGFSIDGNITAKFSAGWENEIKSSADPAVIELGGPAVALVGSSQGVESPTVDSTSKTKGQGGFVTGISGDITQAASASLSKGQTYAASLDGGWENNCYLIAGSVANPYQIAGKRLYRPNNMGSAMVKSRTADLFAIRSVRTKAMLGLTMSVNPEVPEDINIINFKLNPLYVRNGSLDGYIGFDKDEYYRDLPVGKKGSYYKPQQAYRMKSTIEREAQKATANSSRYYANGGFSSDAGKVDALSLANTYVWTADAGTYSEEEGGTASFAETFTGGSNFSLSGGASREANLAVGYGILNGSTTNIDVMANFNLKLNYSHASQTTQTLSLSSSVNSEGFLNRVANFPDFEMNLGTTSTPFDILNSGSISVDTGNIIYDAFAAEGINLTVMNRVEAVGTEGTVWRLIDLYVTYEITNNGSDDGNFYFAYVPTGTADSQYAINFDYATAACPGKVRGYRYMSLFLAADTGNFDALYATGKDQIIDPDWLASDDPDAWALRQAKLRPNAAWRLLHRVTYVNRVPPLPTDWGSAAVPQAQDVSSPPLRPDDHSIHHNILLIDRVLTRLATDAGDTSWADLDLHSVELESVDMNIVVDELINILNELAIVDENTRSAYLADMTTFFELLFMPNQRQNA